METKPIYYTVWLVADQKWSVVVLGLVTTSVCLIAWNYGSNVMAFVSLLLILLTIWYIFVPVRLEINSHGIVRTILGRRRIIRWSDINGYQIRHNGVLILGQRDRFSLEPFCGFFLPVPNGLMSEVLHRFRNCVGE